MAYDIETILVDGRDDPKPDLREYLAKREKANVFTSTLTDEGWTGTARADTAIELQSKDTSSSVGLSLSLTQVGVDYGPDQEEAFIVGMLKDAGGTSRHSGSITWRWVTAAVGTGYAGMILSVPWNSASQQEIDLAIYGGNGMSFWGPPWASAPGYRIVDNYGTERFRDSDVAHGMTALYPTDVYGAIGPLSGTTGGLFLDGLADAGAGAMAMRGTGVTANTTKSTSAVGVAQIYAALKNGTGRTSVGADGNLLVVYNDTTARFIFDAEGSAHSDVEWITFDSLDDLNVLDGLDLEMQRRSGIDREFGEWVSGARETLQREGIVNFYDDGTRAMFNWTKMHMLEVGAIRQVGRAVNELLPLVARVAELERQQLLH